MSRVTRDSAGVNACGKQDGMGGVEEEEEKSRVLQHRIRPKSTLQEPGDLHEGPMRG